MKMVRATEGLWEPLVPITVKLREPLWSGPSPLTVSTLFCPAVMFPGLNEQAGAGLPAQLRLMVPEKLNCEEAETLNTAESVPFNTVAEVLSTVIAYPGTPVPESATVVAGPETLERMASVPDRAPVAVGENVTLIVHVVVVCGGVAQLLV